jgi:hypothetical protein
MSRWSLLLALTLPALIGCGTPGVPLETLVPHENLEDLDDPKAPYFKAMSGHSVGSAILAPEGLSVVDFGLGAVLGVGEEFENVVEVRTLLAGDPAYPPITNVWMSLFLIDAMPAGPQDLLKVLEGEPRMKEQIDPDDDGITFVSEFQVPKAEVEWFPDANEGDEKAFFLVSVFFTTEDGLVIREVVTARASRQPRGDGGGAEPPPGGDDVPPGGDAPPGGDDAPPGDDDAPPGD